MGNNTAAPLLSTGGVTTAAEVGTLMGRGGGEPGVGPRAACGNGAEIDSRPGGTGLPWLPPSNAAPWRTEKCGVAELIRELSGTGATGGGILVRLGLAAALARGRLRGGGGRAAGRVGDSSFWGGLEALLGTGLREVGFFEGDSVGPSTQNYHENQNILAQ